MSDTVKVASNGVCMCLYIHSLVKVFLFERILLCLSSFSHSKDDVFFLFFVCFVKLPRVLVGKVPFPGQFLQLESVSPSSALSKVASARPKSVLLVPLSSDSSSSSPFAWGVVARMVQVVIRRSGAAKMAVRCVGRARVLDQQNEEEEDEAKMTMVRAQPVVPDDEQPALPEHEQSAFRKLLISFFEKSLPSFNPELVNSLPVGTLCDSLGSAWTNYNDQLKVLAASSLSERVKVTAALVNQFKLKRSSSSSSPSSSALLKSAGGTDGGESDMEKLRKKLEKANIPSEQRKEIFKDFAKLQRMQKSSSEYEYILSFLEFAARFSIQNKCFFVSFELFLPLAFRGMLVLKIIFLFQPHVSNWMMIIAAWI